MATASLLVLLCRLQASELKPVVGPRVRVSPPRVGYHGLVDLSIDRDAPNNVVACGYRYSSAQNATVGFVYLSQDGGRTWREVLNDDSSKWVSEDSCASGAGKVFFMGESQILDYGKARDRIPLDEAGDIHLYSSVDGGQRWNMITRHEWIDSSAMVVDSSYGPKRGRMYLFGADQRKDSSSSYSIPQLITTDDGKNLHGPVSTPKPVGFIYRGLYAAAARILPNGDAVAVFMARRRATPNDSHQPQPTEAHVELFATHDGGETVEEIADLGIIHPCVAAMPSLDVDPTSGVIYVAWGSIEEGNCQLKIASSADEGRTWSPARGVAVAGDGYDPAVAVNGKGIVGLFWTDLTRSHCWRFSISADSAVTFSAPVDVSRCVATSQQADFSNSAYATPYVHLKKNNSEGWDLDPDAIGFSVVAARAGMLPWRVGLFADSAGDFHAVWPEPTDEAGALWSTRLTISRLEEDPSDVIDVSHDLALEFLNSEFDPASGVYGVDVVATNVGRRTVRAPISLLVESTYSQFFQSITAIGSDEAATKKSAGWILWPDDAHNLLHPGRKTAPRRISFLLRDVVSNPVIYGDLLAVRMKAFSGQ